MVRLPKVMAIGVTAGLLTATAVKAASPEIGTDVGSHAFASLAGTDVRYAPRSNRSEAGPASSHRLGFYGDGFGYGFGGYDYE